MGREIHILRARVKARIGAMVNIKNDDVDCQTGSLINNLIASALSCNNP